jgi:hypothetical protein
MHVFVRALLVAGAALALSACGGAGSTAPAARVVCSVPALIAPVLVVPALNATGVPTTLGTIVIGQAAPNISLRLVDANGSFVAGGAFTAAPAPPQPAFGPPYYQAVIPALAPHTTYTVHVLQGGLPVQSAAAPCGFPGGVYDATAGSFTTQ